MPFWETIESSERRPGGLRSRIGDKIPKRAQVGIARNMASEKNERAAGKTKTEKNGKKNKKAKSREAECETNPQRRSYFVRDDGQKAVFHQQRLLQLCRPLGHRPLHLLLRLPLRRHVVHDVAEAAPAQRHCNGPETAAQPVGAAEADELVADLVGVAGTAVS